MLQRLYFILLAFMNTSQKTPCEKILLEQILGLTKLPISRLEMVFLFFSRDFNFPRLWGKFQCFDFNEFWYIRTLYDYLRCNHFLFQYFYFLSKHWFSHLYVSQIFCHDFQVPLFSSPDSKVPYNVCAAMKLVIFPFSIYIFFCRIMTVLPSLCSRKFSSHVPLHFSWIPYNSSISIGTLASLEKVSICVSGCNEMCKNVIKFF